MDVSNIERREKFIKFIFFAIFSVHQPSTHTHHFSIDTIYSLLDCVHRTLAHFLTNTCFKLVFETNKVCMRQLIILYISLSLHSLSTHIKPSRMLKWRCRRVRHFHQKVIYYLIQLRNMKTTISKNILCLASITKINHTNCAARANIVVCRVHRLRSTHRILV